jgi:hypothetical protein
VLIHQEIFLRGNRVRIGARAAADCADRLSPTGTISAPLPYPRSCAALATAKAFMSLHFHWLDACGQQQAQ